MACTPWSPRSIWPWSPTYLADLRAAVAIVRANPELAQQGSAATYGMLSHVPLRGMVKRRVLDIFSAMYAPGGGELDLAAGAAQTADESDDGHTPAPMLERLMMKYVSWKSRQR